MKNVRWLVLCLLLISVWCLPVRASVGFDPLPGQMFIHTETFDSADPAGWNLSPSIVPYPHAPTWKTPQPSTVSGGSLVPTVQNGAATFDLTILPDATAFGLNLSGADSSYAVYMRLWETDASNVAATLGFMNFAAEGSAPDPALARYVSGYVRNKTGSGDMLSWGGKNDMDNPADGSDPGLSADVDPSGTNDYAFLYEGDGTSITVSAFMKATDSSEWTSISSGDITGVDTGLGFYSRQLFLWTRYSDGLAIDEFAVSQVPEPATMMLLGLGGLAVLRRKK